VAIVSKPSAAVQRLRLRTQLRKARTSAGLTQKQVAAKMEWSPSKLIRIEAGEVGISVNDLRPLLAEYGITDQDRIDALLDLARGSRKMPFSEYRDIYSKEFLEYLAMESSASVIRFFNPLVLPGLLQTEEYATAVIRAYTRHASEEDIERMIEARLARQDLLQEEGTPELSFILDESVIRRQVGGRGVMRAQLRHLAELTTHPKVDVQVLPFSIGAHNAMLGPFVLFEFDVDEMPDAVYLENPGGTSSISSAPDVTARYLETFWELEDQAVKDDANAMLRHVAAGLEESSEGRLPPGAE
jgi:transcriptional regulator with XRE-family HTH domain